MDACTGRDVEGSSRAVNCAEIKNRLLQSLGRHGPKYVETVS